MCGRYQLSLSGDDLANLYGLAPAPPTGWSPSSNVSPTDAAPVICNVGGRPFLRVLRWGFPASWLAQQGKDPWSRALINARVEDAEHRPTWRESFRNRRCLVPASGFIEWFRRGAERYPVGLSLRGQAHASLGGVWKIHSRDGQPTPVFAILTTEASADLEGIHDRMPVHVPPHDHAAWLDPQTQPARVRALCAPRAAGRLVEVPLSRAYNRPGVEPDPDTTVGWTFGSVGLTRTAGPARPLAPAQLPLWGRQNS